MRQLKFSEKILIFFLTCLFTITFFFSTIFSLKPEADNPAGLTENDPRLLFAGLILFAINIGAFFWTIKIIKRHYDHRNHKGIRQYYFTIFAISTFPTLGFLAFYGAWIYMLVYFFLLTLYVYLINKEFGRLSIKIGKDHDGDLFVGDVTTFNGDIKVRGKNKKMKSSIERIAPGDTIILSRDSETVLTLNVVKNAKKA